MIMNILAEINELKERINALQFVDTEDIVVVNTVDGIEFHLDNPVTAEESGDMASIYNSQFKIIATETGIKVVNGADQDNSKCGTVLAGGLSTEVNATEFSAGDTIWLKTTYDPEAETYAFSLIASDSPTGADFTHHVLIGSELDEVITQDWTDGAIDLSTFNIWLS